MSLGHVRNGAARIAVEHQARPGADGVPLVFLHAGVADRRMWAGELAAFAPRHPVLAYDRRGFGATEVEVPEAHDRLDDLWAVLDEAGIDAAALVGCSQGGRLAIDAALAAPRRVRALALIAPAVGGAPEPAHRFAPALQARIDALEAAESAHDLAAVNRLEAELWLDGALAPPGRVGGAARALFLAMNGIALQAADPGPARALSPAWPRLAEIDCPALVAWGRLDFEHLQQRCEQLLRVLPRVQGLVFDAAGHLPNLEQPAALHAALRRLLAALD